MREYHVRFIATSYVLDSVCKLAIREDELGKDVHVQKAFELFHLLLVNVKQTDQIYMLLTSNKLVTAMMIHQYNFKDMDTLESMINNFTTIFNKLLAHPDELMPIFFNGTEARMHFPLLMTMVSYERIASQMARTNIQKMFLQVADIHLPQLQRYISYFPFANYYIRHKYILLELFKEIATRIESKK